MITVIVPCYNCEKKIQRCLNSILSQTYADFEVLVINDGSTDNTATIVKSFNDSRIRLINQNNSGVSIARNRGISEASGEWIAFVDGDDYIENTYLQSLLLSATDSCLATVNFGKNDLCASVLHDEIGEKYVVCRSMPEDYLIGKLGHTIGFSCWNKLFSKQVLTLHDIRFNPKLKLGEDLIFVFRYLCYCENVTFNESVQYHYCDDDASAVRTAKDKSILYESTLKVLTNICENEYSIGEEALSNWSLEVITYILLNPYVASMTLSEFRAYWKQISNFQIVIFATKKRTCENFRRKAISWAIDRRLVVLLFMMIKAQYLRRKLEKR